MNDYVDNEDRAGWIKANAALETEDDIIAAAQTAMDSGKRIKRLQKEIAALQAEMARVESDRDAALAKVLP